MGDSKVKGQQLWMRLIDENVNVSQLLRLLDFAMKMEISAPHRSGKWPVDVLYNTLARLALLANDAHQRVALRAAGGFDVILRLLAHHQGGELCTGNPSREAGVINAALTIRRLLEADATAPALSMMAVPPSLPPSLPPSMINEAFMAAPSVHSMMAPPAMQFHKPMMPDPSGVPMNYGLYDAVADPRSLMAHGLMDPAAWMPAPWSSPMCSPYFSVA